MTTFLERIRMSLKTYKNWMNKIEDHNIKDLIDDYVFEENTKQQNEYKENINQLFLQTQEEWNYKTKKYDELAPYIFLFIS